MSASGTVTMTMEEFRRSINEARLAVLRLAKSAVVAEYLLGETTEPDDKAYDRAVSDCADAIQTLIDEEMK